MRKYFIVSLAANAVLAAGREGEGESGEGESAGILTFVRNISRCVPSMMQRSSEEAGIEREQEGDDAPGDERSEELSR